MNNHFAHRRDFARSFARGICTRHGRLVGCVHGVLASASKLRPKIVPKHDAASTKDVADDEVPAKRGCRYWPWAALMARSFQIDVEKCPSCGRRMKLVALVQDKDGVARFLERLGEPTDPPARAPARDPPSYRSAVIRRLTSGDLAVA